MTDTSNTVDWSWTVSSDGGLAIDLYEVHTQQNNWGWSFYGNITDAAYPGSISNYRTTNFWKLKVRARNAAGWGSWSESANSTPWAVSTTSRTVSESAYYAPCGCESCGTCGYYNRQKHKTRSKTQDQATWTRGALSEITDWYDTTSYPDWGDVAYGSCYRTTDCQEEAIGNMAEYSGCDWETGNGCLVYVGWYTGGPENQAYRYYSILYGWYVADSAGNATMTCNSGGCLIVSEGIKHCNACTHNKFIPYGIACACFSCC